MCFSNINIFWLHRNNVGVYFGYGNGLINLLLGFLNTHLYPHPIIYSHLLIYSGTICLLWDWLLIWQSICPFLCLLGRIHPSIVLPPLIDWIWGQHTHCCLSSTLAVPFETMSCWPNHALTRNHNFTDLSWMLTYDTAITIAEFSSTISWGWWGGTSHIQIGGHPTRQMFVNTVWFIYDIRISDI